MHLNGSTTTTFIIHLAICDLTYCILHLPIHAVGFLIQGPFLKEPICQISAILRNINVHLKYMFLGMIAVSRGLGITRISILEEYRTLVVVSMYIFSIMMYLPQMMIKVSTHLEFCLMLICSWQNLNWNKKKCLEKN